MVLEYCLMHIKIAHSNTLQVHNQFIFGVDIWFVPINYVCMESFEYFCLNVCVCVWTEACRRVKFGGATLPSLQATPVTSKVETQVWCQEKFCAPHVLKPFARPMESAIESVCDWKCVCVCSFVLKCECMCVSVCVCVSVTECVCVCMCPFERMCLCVCMCRCVRMSVCVCACTFRTFQ